MKRSRRFLLVTTIGVFIILLLGIKQFWIHWELVSSHHQFYDQCQKDQTFRTRFRGPCLQSEKNIPSMILLDVTVEVLLNEILTIRGLMITIFGYFFQRVIRSILDYTVLGISYNRLQ